MDMHAPNQWIIRIKGQVNSFHFEKRLVVKVHENGVSKNIETYCPE